MSEAHDRLRQYLEQRREQGESEYVLDTLSVEDALRVLTGKAAGAGVAESGSAQAPRGGRGAAGSRVADGDPAPRPDSAMRRAAEVAAASGDWREALRNVDAGQLPTAPRDPAAAPKPVAGQTHPAEPPPAHPAEPPPALQPPAKSAASGVSTAPTGQPLDVGANAGPSPLGDLPNLGAVAAAIAQCTACTLSASALNHVPGEGNPQARFVVVGEAPGQKEDELGRPFAGKSGDLLTKILDAIGFKREDVFICNVLKHRPPANRNPSPEEILACRPYLLRQLELLNPKVILALGTFAAQTLLETDSTIGKLRGLEHRCHGIPLVATYHPAALLRNPNWKRPAWEDVQLARRIFDRP